MGINGSRSCVSPLEIRSQKLPIDFLRMLLVLHFHRIVSLGTQKETSIHPPNGQFGQEERATDIIGI